MWKKHNIQQRTFPEKLDIYMSVTETKKLETKWKHTNPMTLDSPILELFRTAFFASHFWSSLSFNWLEKKINLV